MTAQATALSILTCVAVSLPSAPAQPPTWEYAARETENRTGIAPVWDRGEIDPLVDELLADGLGEEEAVRMALLDNAQLRVAFDELGIAQADVIAAGLYSNPDLGVVLRFPEGERGNDLEAELGFSVADLWLVPARKRVATARAEQLTMAVVSEVLNTAADAKLAHNACVIATATRDQAAAVLEAAEAWRNEIRHRAEFGFHSELDLSMTDVFVAQQALELEEADAEVAIAHARLRRVTGVATAELRAVGDLPAPPEELADTDLLVAKALENRPDLQAADLGLKASGHALALERRSIWRHVTLGPAFAHDPGGENLWGGLLQVELPVFDRNRGGRARAKAGRQQAGSQLDAAEAAAREQVTIAAETLRLAVARERILRGQILPARRAALGFSTRYHDEMQLNMLYMLDARRELYAAQREHTAALGAIRAAEIELEFAVGGSGSED